MSLDTTNPPLPPNAAEESGGNLDRLVRLLQDPVQLDDDGSPIVAISPASLDVLETVLRQLIAATLGPSGSPGAPLNVAVGAASVQALGANPGRKGLTIANVSQGGQRIALALAGGTAVLDAGMVLWPQTWWWMDRYSFTTGAVWAIASAAGGALAIQEFS